MARKLTAIDLFSGAGGLSLAAHNVGINILAAVENDKNAALTYKTNLVERLNATTEVFDRDINEVDIKAFMHSKNLQAGDLDLLLGGPPCQGFSSHRINDAGTDDPRNKLLLSYFEFVKSLKPKAFLVENVPGLLWPRHEKFLKKFLNLAKRHGYHVVTGKPLILNARDYGVPQNRRRAFIFALRNDVMKGDISWPPKPTHHKSGPNEWLKASSVFEQPKKSILNTFKRRLKIKYEYTNSQAAEIIDSLAWGAPLLPSDPCNTHMEHSATLTKVFSNTPLLGDRSESGRELECHKNYSGHRDVYGRMYPHLPSNTITTGCNNPSKGRFVHPWLNHGITLRHAARLQTFPDKYIFKGGVMSVAKQIGNAVPIKLGEALISEISKLLSA